MAISVPAASASASSAVSEANTPLPSCLPVRRRHSKVSFSVSTKPKLRFVSKGMRSGSNHTVSVKAQLSKVAVDGSSNDAATPGTKSVEPAPETMNDKLGRNSSPSVLASKDSINEFINQVASLVKLVDSRDIVELQMKQLDCEVLIRKKEAVTQPLSPAPVVMMQPSPPTVSHQPAPPSTAPGPVPVASPAPAAKPAKSSLPALKSPMAGTFYRSPAPGEPPFVKVGDKVQKGQVLCIIEAMKLMNEIEADQSGTVVDILAEDRKPVSIEMPLFVIQP
ncbi:hypothetical protein Ancab_006841 [Ancistrocladus abbreviatus]